MSRVSVCATSGDAQTTRNTNTPTAGCWIWSVLLWWAWPLNSRGLLLKVSHSAEDSHGTLYQPDCSESHKANLLRAWHTTTSCDGQCKFAKEWCFDHVTSSPHYPKSNGFIKRTVKTMKMTLKKAKSSKLDPYIALLCIRTTPVDNVLPSPAEMLYTRKVQGNLPVRMRNKFGNKEEIYERLQQRQEVERTNHNQHSRDLSPLFPEQNVRIQTLPSSLWSPAVVREKCQEPRSYVVETQNGRVLRRNRQHTRGVE